VSSALTESRRQALRSASHWYAVLSDGRVNPQQEARWQQWYEQNRDHQWAWQQVENLRQQMGQLPGGLASRTLNDSRLTRRHVLKGLMLLLAAGGSWQLWNSELAEGLRADYRTAKGLPRRQTLNDGTLLTLNTESAADVRFDAASAWFACATAKLPLLPPVTASSDRFASRPAKVYSPRWDRIYRPSVCPWHAPGGTTARREVVLPAASGQRLSTPGEACGLPAMPSPVFSR
jgi:hypothetical protein